MNFLTLHEIKTTPSLEHRLEETPPSLKESLKRFGIQTPLLVTPNRLLVSGYRRLSFAKSQNMKKVPVQVLPEMTIKELFFCLLNEQENSFPLSPIEKIRLFTAFASAFPRENHLSLLPALSLPQDQNTLKLLPKVAQLPMNLQLALHEKRANPGKFLPVLFLETEAQEKLGEWLSQKEISLSLFQELCQALHSVKVKTGKPASSYLDVENPKKLREKLTVLRYPETTNFRQRWQEALNLLNFPRCVKWELSFPPRTLRLSFEIETGKELEKLLEWFQEKKEKLLEFMQKLEQGELP